MSTGLVYHNDLDGLYSAKLIVESGYDLDEAFQIDYGMDYSRIIDRHDHFIFVDYSENFCGDKTDLFVDHHIRGEESSLAKREVIVESKSCVQALIENDLVDKTLISKEMLKYINIVDSAGYRELLSKDFTPIDVIFPDTKTELGKFIILNELLRKNKKTNLSLSLLDTETFDVNTMLYKIESFSAARMKYDKYIENKMMFFDKMQKSSSKLVKEFSNVPILFTRDFTQLDWKGYDRNIFNFMYDKNVFTAVIFEMGGLINVQMQKNPFYIKEFNKSLYSIAEHLIDKPRGHENILMLTFDTIDEAILKLNDIIECIDEIIN